MIQTLLEISPRGYSTCEITRKIPVKVTIVAIQYPVGYGYLEALSGREKSIKEYIESLNELKHVQEYEVIFSSPSVYWTRSVFTQDYSSIYKTVLDLGSMPILPITISSGTQYYTILSPSSELLKILLIGLKKKFTSVEIKSLSSIPFKSKESILTRKQLDTFKLAFDQGYYRIPKDLTLNDLAQKLGIKRTSMQERLKRAEKRILTDYRNKLN
jgi:predicted DNA binding protein